MKDILLCLEAILRQGYSSFEIFNDWLDLMLFALQRDNPQYLQVVNKYRNNREEGKREIDYFCKAFACLQIEMQKTNDDVLGQVYMEWNQNNKYRGQFFTPKHVASMMAKMLKPKGRILDPCCGSGIMLIETIKTMDNERLDNSVFVGQDLDLTCIKMCALNLLFFNVNGFVVWGDSLALECKKVYETARSYVGGSIRELKGESFDTFKESHLTALTIKQTERENVITEITDSDHENLIKPSEQLMLF